MQPLRRLVCAYLETVLPLAEWTRVIAVDDLLEDVMGHIAAMPTRLRIPLQTGLMLLEAAPIATRISMSLFTQLDPATRLRALHAIEKKPGLVFAGMLEALQTMVFMCLGARPEVHEIIGVDRTAFIAERRAKREHELARGAAPS